MINLFRFHCMVERLRLSKFSVLREILLFVAQYIMCCALINSIECHYLRCPISRIMHPISVSSPNLAVPPSLLASRPHSEEFAGLGKIVTLVSAVWR